MSTRFVAWINGNFQLWRIVRRAGFGVKGFSQGPGWGMFRCELPVRH